MKELVVEILSKEKQIIDKLRNQIPLDDSDLNLLLLKSILEESFGEGKDL